MSAPNFDDQPEWVAAFQALHAALHMLTEQHTALTKQVSELTRRLQHYEAHVPAIKQAKAALDRGKKNGLIVVQEL